MPDKMATLRSKIARGASIEAVFLNIREMIVYGRLAPGSWIVEGDIAERLGVSRTPVRHALQWLEHEGYLVALGAGPKSRMTVSPLTVKDAKEAYRIVGHMEGLAGRLAAELPKQERGNLVKALKELNTQMTKADNKTQFDPKVFFDLDTEFHSSIVEATAGTRFLSIYNGIKPHTERYWWLYASSIVDDEKISIREHANIISAIANGDPDSAEKALQANWENGANRLVGLIQKFGERGKW
ncbi:MAG TPA: GntR family transcriptional regulator [Acidobacteriaceae bacterium]|jgi:DNA-binding GntR family transcriptional regulator|nr:GntR family transcriptional regulator [Acidobacteriaceae bacterium]